MDAIRDSRKAAKIAEHVITDVSWIAGEKQFEITRLETLLRSNECTAEEREIALAMLQFHTEVSS